MEITLKALRANNNLTQKQAAERLGISENTWVNWENAKRFPDVPKIIIIEKEFKISHNEKIFYPPLRLNHNGGGVKKSCRKSRKDQRHEVNREDK